MDEPAVSDIEPYMIDPAVFPMLFAEEDKVSRPHCGERDMFPLPDLFP